MRERPADTSPEADTKYRALILRRSAEERLRMASEMFTAAGRLMVASLPAHVAADPIECKIALLLRTYPHDLDEAFLAGIVADMRQKR